MAGWFCTLLNNLLVLLNVTQNLIQDGSGDASWQSLHGADRLYFGSNGLTVPQQTPGLDQTIGSSPDSAFSSVNQLSLNNEPSKLPITSDATTITTDATIKAEADVITDESAPGINALNHKPSVKPPKPVAALGSDLNKNSALSAVGKATNLGPVLRFARAVQELNLTKIGDDFDENTQKMIKDNFAKDSKDKYLNTTQLIKKCGLKVEEYTVKTPDGYYLKLYRIPGPGQPVLIQHGLMSCSDDYLTSGCEKSLPYLVSAAGYDVWLGNARGNKYSQRHDTLDPSDIKFWDFSWHQIGVIDLPTMIDFILVFTKQPKLSYIGHSQGTTAAFVLLSEKAEYNDKFNLMVALSPVVWMGNMFSHLLHVLCQFVDETDYLQQIIGMGKFAVGSEFEHVLRVAVCGTSATAAAVCDPQVSSMFGFSPAHKNFEYLPMQTTHIFTSSSSRQVIHYLQEIRSGKFQQFDYGAEKNKAIYGSSSPPEYDVRKVSAPVALFYSSNDWMAAVTDVEHLKSLLPNVVYSNLLSVEYNHIDFLWGDDATELVYLDLLDLLEKYSEGDDYGQF